MSIRAYKIQKIKNDPTFNLSQSWELIDEVVFSGNACEGYLSIEKEDILEALKKYKKDKEKIEILQAILKDIGTDSCVKYITY
jgi:ribosomal protein L9